MNQKTIVLTVCLFLIVETVFAQAGNTGRPGRPTIAAQRSLIFVPQFNFGNSLQGTGGVDTSGANAVLAFKKLQERADDNFNDGHYRQAHSEYLQLAQFNDKYSQYMLGHMYANGLGVDKNLQQAFAWSYVSAETRQKALVNAHVGIRDMLSPQQLDQARDLADEYHEEYGTYAVANKARRIVRKSKRSCTGSRLGSSCDRVAAASLNCNINAQGLLAGECLTFGSIGLPAVAGLQPSDIRTVEKHLKDLIREYNPGRVELGDLEIIED